MKKRVLALVLSCAMVLSLAACGSSAAPADAAPADAAPAAEAPADAAPAAEAAAPAGERGECAANLDYKSADLSGKTIGYVTISGTAPWGGLVGTSFMKYAEEVGATCKGLDAQTDIDKVAEYCQQMIDAGVDALVLFGGDIYANCEIAKAASEAGVPMFMAGLDVAEEGRDYIAAVVGPDQYQMTADIAAYIVEKNGTDATYKVAQINGVPFLEDYIQRCAGFASVMSQYPNYDISAAPADCFSSRTDAKSATEQFLATYPDLNIIMGFDDDLTMGAVQAIDEAGKTGEILVYSLTGQNDAIQAVADGKIQLTVVNRAQDIGAGLVTAIAEYYEKGSTTYYQRTPLTFVDSSNVADWVGKGEF